MSEKLNSLVERQNTLWHRMQEIRNGAEDRDLTGEERENWDKAERELSEVSGDIERYERMAKLEAPRPAAIDARGDVEPAEVTDQGDVYERAFAGYLRGGMDVLSNEERVALRGGYVKDSEARALNTTPGSVGGFLVPEGFRNTLTETLKAFGGILSEANVITTETGNPLPWPTNDDTGNKGAILAHNTTVPEQDVAFGQKDLGAHTYTSRMVLVPWQLLQDSAFDLNAWLPRKLGERIGRAVAEHLAVGTGSGQPQGITVGGVSGVTKGVAASPVVTYDDLIDLEHSVNSAYRTGARYVFADSTLKELRKLKDQDDRPLWVPIPAPGFTATLNGHGYTVDDDMPAIAPTNKPIAFGNLRLGYVVRQVRAVTAVRLDERYADKLQTGFFAYSRLDAVVDDSAAFRLLELGAAS